MALNDQEVAVKKPAETVSDPLASNGNSDVDSDDRADPKEKSFADESNALDDSNDFDDMKSLLPTGEKSGNTPVGAKSKISSLNIDNGDDDDEEDDDLRNNALLQRERCCFGLIRCARVGNMRILFPEYFFSSGWGVVGPNLLGPVIVWLILVTATHGVLNGIEKHNLGIGSSVMAYFFLGISTYRLTDVCYRDPGIVLDQEIPGHEPPERAREYRYCDRCKVWQPPDGVHCPECNVCVRGYDHYCVWMGTSIGVRNYRQFVKFNMTWLLYAMYALFWVAAIGPLLMKKFE